MISEGGICTGCDYELRQRRASDLLAKLSVPAGYSGSALYAVVFDNGIKIGIAKTYVTRMIDYGSPWCRRILLKIGVAAPRRLLKDMERAALARFGQTKRQGEFVHLVGRQEALDTMEHVCAVFYNELTEYSETWDDS